MSAEELCSDDFTSGAADPDIGNSVTDTAMTIAIVTRIKRIKVPFTGAISALIMAPSSQ